MSVSRQILRCPCDRAGVLALAGLVLLAGCSSDSDRYANAPYPANPPPAAAMAPAAPPGSWERPPTAWRPPRVILRRPGYDVVGIASWYGRRFHGRRTASGEIFNMNAATAAHPTLPFGTRAQVTNLENGRSVIVRINDRGPFTGRRIIDVSRRAAQRLGFLRQGTARVRVRVLDPEQAAK